MKPFRLDSILDYRKRLEDIAQNRLSEAKRQQELVQKKLTSETQQLSILINKTEELQSKPISILDLINYENRITYSKNNIEAIKKKLSEKNEIMDRERLHLLEKSRDRKILEKLKTQQNASWKQYLDKKEMAMLDEIAIVKHKSDR